MNTPFFIENFSWMGFNAILAFVPVVLVVVMRHKLSRVLHLTFFLLWLIFLPNTIYLITDLQHVGAQLLKSPILEQIILILQYIILAVLGVVAYVYSLEPISNILKKLKIREMNYDLQFIILNYIVAFGVMLGKFQRTHSWYIFTQPTRVVDDVFLAFSSSSQIVWVLIIGTIINVFFFLFRDYFPPLRRLRVKGSKKKKR